ncbi:hypothetical protein VCHA50P415_170030 [Vibrio chagasii]|nr:hypothetical protein VCHA34P114_190030 [Vibrio chagasii]CAH6878888.1 hypothetical protein VCHA28FP16_250032 [Vibrio chagasii]CAH6937732.1 hypothetical protein VCHA50P415_170030 [Vibrio chagasii]CAH7149831.1 hypothetical protein VCHA37P199_210032 [Vibrio chagasii]CAH7198393.1 hypothetical protein VCHA50O384_170030 [Vibrio chagasii]
MGVGLMVFMVFALVFVVIFTWSLKKTDKTRHFKSNFSTL